jgi:hypothetical protein
MIPVLFAEVFSSPASRTIDRAGCSSCPPTYVCRSYACIAAASVQLPRLRDGDWLMFPYAGAYTISSAR